ncbi:zinc-dependent metalloprotease family protein, partial [Streptomyces sp. NPDC005533]|uniref:zinc-dependent metalloprotease family protein n=1 Tax=Streptomyces sp. NPDC005533 TaxID=3364723 RepID=UPI0036A10C20
SGWERLGGMLASAPAAAARGSMFEVLALGADSAAWCSTEERQQERQKVSDVRLHAKILADPDVPVSQSIARMAEIYDAVGISVELASTEDLNIPDLLDVDVGGCIEQRTTAEQETLFAHRSEAGSADIVVYFVRSTVPPYNGCAAHPPGIPAVVIAQGATQWTLAHEVGHVLGLRHVDDNDRLMTGNGTRNITNPPPELVAEEAVTVVRSAFSLES